VGLYNNDIIIAQGKSIYFIGIVSKNESLTFELKDRYDLKGGIACFHATPTEDGTYLTTIVFDGSSIVEVVLGDRKNRL